MNAQQMQELCRELMTELSYIAKANPAKWGDMSDQFQSWAQSRARFALDKAKTAFNPTPNTNGCVETAATVPSSDGTGETVKALGVGSCCPVCGALAIDSFPSGDEYSCGHVEWKFYDTPKHQFCIHAEHLAITRAKQLAEAEAALKNVASGGGYGLGVAKDYFRNKPKEPTA